MLVLSNAESAHRVTIDLRADLGIGSAKARDLYTRTELGELHRQLTTDAVGPRDSRLFVLTPTATADGAALPPDNDDARGAMGAV